MAAVEVDPAGRPAPMRPLHDLEPNLDVAAGGVGIGANLMRLFHQSLCLGMREAGKRDIKADLQAKTTGRTWSDADRRGHRRISGHFRAALRSHELHRADEAGGISGREKLFGIVAGAATASELLWRGEFDVQRSIERGSFAVTAASRLGTGPVEHIYRHGGLLRVGSVPFVLHTIELRTIQIKLTLRHL